jgi:hypothetical protein
MINPEFSAVFQSWVDVLRVKTGSEEKHIESVGLDTQSRLMILILLGGLSAIGFTAHDGNEPSCLWT